MSKRKTTRRNREGVGLLAGYIPHIRCQEHLADWVRTVAHLEGVPITAVVVRALEAYRRVAKKAGETND